MTEHDELRTTLENIIQPVAVSYSKGQRAIEEILSMIGATNTALQSRLKEAVDALERLQYLCGEQGWWLKSFAVDEMDAATKAISKAKAVKG